LTAVFLPGDKPLLVGATNIGDEAGITPVGTMAAAAEAASVAGNQVWRQDKDGVLLGQQEIQQQIVGCFDGDETGGWFNLILANLA